jgi:N-acetylglucosamine kinase-like BadF-type ATPase
MKKKMVIEAGGTNSQILFGGDVLENSSPYKGLNGNMHSADYIDAYFKELNDTYKGVEEIIFYGAGVNGEGGKTILETIQRYFRLNAEIHSDLLAVCRGLLGRDSGHCFILGTGANACYYDGESIVENHSGHGIILGDEGSGAYIGKLFIQDILNKTVPQEIDKEFRKDFSLSDKDIINQVYHGESLSGWLGHFAKYIVERKEDDYFKKLISRNFDDFFEKTVLSFHTKVTNMNMNGGFIFAVQSEFKQVAEEKGFNIAQVVERSIDALEKFHFKK